MDSVKTFHRSVSPLLTNVQRVYLIIKSASTQGQGMWSITGKYYFTAANEGPRSIAFLTYEASALW